MPACWKLAYGMLACGMLAYGFLSAGMPDAKLKEVLSAEKAVHPL